MSDFSSAPIPSNGNLSPQTFNAGALSSKLPEQSSRPSRSDVVGSGSDMSHLVATPYGQRPKRVEKVEKPKELKPKSTGKTAIGTGASFRRTGTGGLDEKVSRMSLSGKVSLSGVNADERKKFGDIVEQHARNISTGGKLSEYSRGKMKDSVRKAGETGAIRKEHTEKFKKIIGNLE